MKTYKLTKDMIPGQAFHPGTLLKDEIEYRNITQKKLADEMEIATTVLREIIHGKRNLTAELALKLEKALDIDAIFWMRLQVKFEIDSLRIQKKEQKPLMPRHRNRKANPYSPLAVTQRYVREPKEKYRSKKPK